MHLIIILLVIVVLLLGGWWILAIGIGALLAVVGAVIAGVIWIVKALWPFLAASVGGFLLLGCIGWLLEATGRVKWSRPKQRAADLGRTLPPISRRWAERKASRAAESKHQD